jgi:phosphatidylserine decarboxylase
MTQFGHVAYIPVGSVCIGSIVFEVEKGESFTKGQELGYFQYGGSTVVMLFQNGTINWWQDIQFATAKGVETLVQANTRIAEKIFV